MTKDRLAWQLANQATFKENKDYEPAKGGNQGPLVAELRLHNGTKEGFVLRCSASTTNEMVQGLKKKLLKLADSPGDWK